VHSKSSVAVRWGQFGSPGRETSATGSTYLRTGGTADQEDSVHVIVDCKP
jgi:hypothetical protein